MGKGSFLWASESATSTQPRNWGAGLRGKGPASLGWSLSLPHREDSDPAGAPSCLLHRGTPVRSPSTSRCHLPLPWGQRPGWARLQELQTSRQTAGRKDATPISRSGDGGVSPQGGGRAASGLLGQEQTTSEQEGFAPRLALGVPKGSCALLPRRCKSLLPQGRGQGGWRRSCGSIHVTLVLQQRSQPLSHGMCPGGAEPCLGTSRSGGG